MADQQLIAFLPPKNFFWKAISLSFAAFLVTLAAGCAGVRPTNMAMPAASPLPSPAANQNATTFVYLTESSLGSGNLITLNTKDGSMSMLPIAGAPAAVAVSPDGLRAYVTEPVSNSVIVVDTRTNTMVTSVPVGKLPWRIAVSPDGKFVYVTNMNDGTGLSAPSGYEVESATFHIPVTSESTVPMERSGFRGKLDDLRSRGMSKVHEVQHRLADSSKSMKVAARDNVSRKVETTRTSMRTKPMLWAGIAAGSGFAIGMLGRILDARKSHRRMTPDLVIIDASC